MHPDPPASDTFSPLSTPPRQTYEIRFTGSGSEYFRIWIVNLLLTLVTLTLYWPYARARRLRYFRNHTLIDGSPLGFHAEPHKMFRGYLFVVLFALVYSAATKFFPHLAWLALVLLATVYPLLWHASLQFRLHHTSWRGIRFRFVNTVRPVYWVIVALFVPWLALERFLPYFEALDPDQMLRMLGLFCLGLLSFALLLPWLIYQLKRYQYSGYAFLQERSQLDAGPRAFYRVFLNSLWLSLASALVVLLGLLALICLLSLDRLLSGTFLELLSLLSQEELVSLLVLILSAFLSLMYLAFFIVVIPYFSSRMQNLVWSNIHSEHLHFTSELRFDPCWRLSLSNWFLTLCTLGLYWPVARVHLARLKLEAISITLTGKLEDQLAQAQPAAQGSIGDAASQFLGLDIGF